MGIFMAKESSSVCGIYKACIYRLAEGLIFGGKCIRMVIL